MDSACKSKTQTQSLSLVEATNAQQTHTPVNWEPEGGFLLSLLGPLRIWAQRALEESSLAMECSFTLCEDVPM